MRLKYKPSSEPLHNNPVRSSNAVAALDCGVESCPEWVAAEFDGPPGHSLSLYLSLSLSLCVCVCLSLSVSLSLLSLFFFLALSQSILRKIEAVLPAGPVYVLRRSTADREWREVCNTVQVRLLPSQPYGKCKTVRP